MGRGPLNFRQRDLKAAAKALEDAGLKVSKVGLDKDGGVIIYVGGSNIAADNAGKRRPSEWERISNEELEQARAKTRLHQKLG
jgi:hypothetical protein